MIKLDVQNMIDACQATGGGFVDLPSGVWECSPFEIPTYPSGAYAHPVHLRGAASYGRSASTILRFDAGEVNATPRKACAVISEKGCAVQGITLESKSNVDRASWGFLIRGHAVRIRDCSAHFMEKAAFTVRANTADGSNANGFLLETCRGSASRNGFYIDGAETNAGVLLNCTCEGNEEYGFFESSFLGNLYLGCHSSTSGIANYAQGGSLENPLEGGVSNYSSFVGCYSEGGVVSPFRSAQVYVVGGNLSYTCGGWDGAEFPGARSGYKSRLRFEWGGVTTSMPSNRSPLHAILQDGERPWYICQKWLGSPAWLDNAVALLRYDHTGWLAPYAATEAAHPAGPGRRIHATPLLPTPHDFALTRSITLHPGESEWLQFDSELLREESGGYLGELVIHSPAVQPVPAGFLVATSSWERVDINSMRVRLTLDGPGDVEVTVGLIGFRVSSPSSP